MTTTEHARGTANHKLPCSVLAICLLSAAMTAQARTRPAAAADGDDHQAAWAAHQALETQSPYPQWSWRNIGPIIQGGRLVDIEVHPDNPYTFYVAYASGGLWKTTDNGVNFKPIFDDQPTQIMGDVALDPSNPDTLWVGTGENNSSRSSYGGMGVYRSTDGGQTWSHRGLGDSDRIGTILVDPANSDRVLVASLGKLYTPGGQRGIYLTEDAGETWTEVLAGGDWTGVVDLAAHPENFDTLYAASWERQRSAWNFVEGGEGSGIWRSDDRGLSWTRLGGGLPASEHVGRIGLAVTAASPDTLYASIDNQTPLPKAEWDLGENPLGAKRLATMTREEFLKQDPDAVEAFIRSNDLPIDLTAESLLEMLRNGELDMPALRDELNDANSNLFNADIESVQVWRSDDRGESWTITHEDPLQQVVFSYGYYFGEIRVSPTDADRVYVLGVPIITSEDGGKTWSSIQDPDVHVDYQSMWINPEFTDHLMVGNDGGLDVSFDGGKSWVKLDAQPMGQFYTVNVDMATPYNIYGGLQDNGTIRCPSNNDWTRGEGCQRINGGDGMYVSVDPRDNKTVYTGYQFGNYVRIDPDQSRHEVRPRDAIGEPSLRYNWNSPVILSSHNPDIVYFGANKLYRSMDQGDQWTAISDDLTRSKARGDVPFATLTSIDESVLQFGLIWAGTDDGQLWMSDNGGARWTDVGRRLPADRWVSRVEASPHRRDTAYVTLNGYRNDDITAYVYRSDDLGKRWTDISTGLPAEPVNVIVADPVVDKLLYLGTDRGVYVSTDDGDSWSALQSGLPNVPVHDLVVHPRDRELVAGTHGRSFWVLDVLPIQELALADEPPTLQLFPVDSIQASRGWKRNPSRWYAHLSEPPEVSVDYYSTEAGRGDITITNSDKVVVASWSEDLSRGLDTLTWDLMVDQAAVIEAEQAAWDALEADQQTQARRPYQQAVELGQPLRALPGDYTLTLVRAQEEARIDLTIKPPTPWKPRTKDSFTLRGRK